MAMKAIKTTAQNHLREFLIATSPMMNLAFARRDREQQ